VSPIDPDLLPQALPDGWVSGSGRHMGGMVVFQAPEDGYEGEKINPTEWRLLSDMLWDSGVLDQGDLYYTFLVKVPLDPERADEQVEAAMPYLIEEIQHVVPRFVLALGQEVFGALGGTGLKLPLYRGNWYRLAEPFDWEEGLVLGTWSPREVLDNPKKGAPFRRDVGEFARAWTKVLGA